jgi:hypothetical protein
MHNPQPVQKTDVSTTYNKLKLIQNYKKKKTQNFSNLKLISMQLGRDGNMISSVRLKKKNDSKLFYLKDDQYANMISSVGL